MNHTQIKKGDRVLIKGVLTKVKNVDEVGVNRYVRDGYFQGDRVVEYEGYFCNGNVYSEDGKKRIPD